MIDWESLYQYERDIYIEKAKRLIETGSYTGFTVNELAVFMYR